MKLWNRSQRIDARRTPVFKSTFSVWNDECYNARQSIGYSMKLIKECCPDNPSDWEMYYLNSGNEAKYQKEVIPNIYDEKTINRMIRSINVNHGKTRAELEEIGSRFKDSLDNNGIHISSEEAFNFVYIRAIDEAWIGYQRELAAEKALKEFCSSKGLKLHRTSENFDVRKGVDWEIYNGKTLVCGIQVKGSAYKTAVQNNGQMKEYDNNLKRQNRTYTGKTGAPVFYLFVKRDLSMENLEELNRKVNERLGIKENSKENAKTQKQETSKPNTKDSQNYSNSAPRQTRPKSRTPYSDMVRKRRYEEERV